MRSAVAHPSVDPALLAGLDVPTSRPDLVVATIDLRPEHIDDDGAVRGGIVMALADFASSRGARLNLLPGRRTRTLESKTNFLAVGVGPSLRAEASPVHVGATVSVWRACLYRGGTLVGEVTQTQIIVEGDEEGKAVQPEAPLRPTRPRGVVSGNFSQSVIDERWRQILDGAFSVIAAKGFAKATIREIAAAAEMPVPTMYQYLERKEDILYNIYKFFMTDIVVALQRWRASDTAPKDRLAGAVRTMVEVFDRNHRFIKLMFQETRALTPDARRQVYELDAQYIAILRDLLAEAANNGEVRIHNVELAANFVYFLCTIWPLRFWSIGKFGEEHVTNEIVEFVLNGLGASPASAPD